MLETQQPPRARVTALPGRGERRWQAHSGRVLDTVHRFDVIECGRCGFRHVVPLPSPSDLERVYREEYYTTDKPCFITRAREDLRWWELVYSDRYDSFEARLPLDRRRILDVGAGPGFFLAHGQQRGWRGLGLEPSTAAAAHARTLGLEVRPEFLDQRIAPELGTFDVVHLSEVLEHLPDPAHLLALAHGLLAPGGPVCVVVPNDYSPFQRALRSVRGFSPWWVAPPHHLNYFDRVSLTRLLERTGFEVVAVEATFPIDLFLLMGDDYVGNDELGRSCHQKRMAFELALATAGLGQLKRALYRAFATLDVGRELQLLARVLG